MESHYLFTVMWISWNHFLTSLALLKRSCGWAVCLEWEITSKLVPLLIISTKKLKIVCIRIKLPWHLLRHALRNSIKKCLMCPRDSPQNYLMYSMAQKWYFIIESSLIQFVPYEILCNLFEFPRLLWLYQNDMCQAVINFLVFHILVATKRKLKLKLQVCEFVNVYDWVNTFSLSYLCHFSWLPAFFLL